MTLPTVSYQVSGVSAPSCCAPSDSLGWPFVPVVEAVTTMRQSGEGGVSGVHSGREAAAGAMSAEALMCGICGREWLAWSPRQ